MSLTFYAHISSCFINIPYGWDFQKYFSDSEVQVFSASKLQKHLWLHEEYPVPPKLEFNINTRLKPSISSELPQDSDTCGFKVLIQLRAQTVQICIKVARVFSLRTSAGVHPNWTWIYYVEEWITATWRLQYKRASNSFFRSESILIRKLAKVRNEKSISFQGKSNIAQLGLLLLFIFFWLLAPDF